MNEPKTAQQINAPQVGMTDAELIQQRQCPECERLQIQRDQVLHLLQGGSLTDKEVEASGLGIGVLSEQRHHEYMRTKAENELKVLRGGIQSRKFKKCAICGVTISFARYGSRSVWKHVRNGKGKGKERIVYDHAPRPTLPDPITSKCPECERLHEEATMKLVAVMTASMQNTEATIKDRIDRNNPYWSQAYADVCTAVDREMRERNEKEKAQAACAARGKALESALSACEEMDGVSWYPESDINSKLFFDLANEIRKALALDCGKGWMQISELEYTKGFLKWLKGLLENAADGHKQGCICWTCTALRDSDRELSRLEKLKEDK